MAINIGTLEAHRSNLQSYNISLTAPSPTIQKTWHDHGG